MAKKLLRHCLTNDQLLKVVKAANMSLQRLESKASSSDWVDRLEDRFNDFSNWHSDEETVAFIASVSECMVRKEDNKISIKMFPEEVLAHRVGEFSSTKRKFTLRFKVAPGKDEFLDVIFN